MCGGGRKRGTWREEKSAAKTGLNLQRVGVISVIIYRKIYKKKKKNHEQTFALCAATVREKSNQNG